jgi:acyl carrier protein
VLTIPPPLDPRGTVLITGGGGLGALVAQHLAAHKVVLASRSGTAPEGLDARVETCDVTDRDQLAQLIDSIPDLTAVIHTAGILDDATIETLDPEQLHRVMRPKVDAAHHLHQLTQHKDLAAFVLFSSAAATLGAPGQANYAAANAFLDALAQNRHANGLPASSLAWGLWELTTEMAAGLGEVDRARIHRAGMLPLSSERGLELFDTALTLDEPALVPVQLDLAMLRAQGRAGALAPLLSGLVRVPAKRADGHGSLAKRLAETPEAERDAVVLELVRTQVAAVLGHSSPEAIDPQRAFKELGFDSLAAVELRNRLSQASGLRLPATLVFDYPTSAAAAGYLRAQVGDDGAAQPRIDEQLDKLDALLESMAADDTARDRVSARLRAFLLGRAGGESTNGDGAVDEDLESASDDELLEIFEGEFGG